MSKDDPNNQFPDTSIESSSLLENKLSGLQENFKITQRGGGLKPMAATKNKSFLAMRNSYQSIRD